ncbi:MAG: PAQR family membrane homeostasis protein TrhA [Arenimonas sp.]
MDHAPHPHEERWNALSHGLGAVLAVVGASVLVALVAMRGDDGRLVAAIVFGTALVVLYLASTLYHAIPHPPAKARLKVFDHCAIYGLIAGSYTPFALVGLRDRGGAWLLAAVWTLAVLGVVFKWFYTGRFKGLSTALYLGMGWLALVVAGPMSEVLPVSTLAWLLAGGLAYSAGTVFYLSKRPFAHAVWHGFVLAGSVCHYIAVTQHLLAA